MNSPAQSNAPRRILFVNYATANCGVHQYGRTLFSAIEKSRRFLFELASIHSLREFDDVVANGDFAAIVVNYHPETLPFVHVGMPRRYPVPCVAVMHEMTQAEADRMPRGIFQYYVMGDPTLNPGQPYVFSTGRILRHYENHKPLPALTTIGSFGFSVGSKGFQRLIDAVQEEFDEAVIRINIPPNGIIDREAALAKRQADLCRSRIWKPGIRLEATHQFLDDGDLMDFLAGNTLNAFLYDYLPKAGISSVPDHALAARRPIAVTRSIMFRHLIGLDPPITFEDASLRDIIRNGARPFDHLLREWTPENICLRYEQILERVLSDELAGKITAPGFAATLRAGLSRSTKRLTGFAARVAGAVRHRIMIPVIQPLGFSLKSAAARVRRLAGGARPAKRFNRILDDAARIELAMVIRRLAEFAPEIVAKKIPRANIQQAFVFDAVDHFAQMSSRPRILCIGSFEDSAAAALKKVGYEFEEIDPAVNRLDLGAFCRLPTTRKGSYDIVFSTSVIEHVKDDGAFLEQLAGLLAPGGVGILTCDFMEGYRLGDPVIGGNYRFYTRGDLTQRLAGRLPECDLVDAPAWNCPNPDFELGGFRYTFATLVFRKRAVSGSRASWERLLPAEQASFFNDNGYLVIPRAMTQAEVTQAISEIGEYGLHSTTEAIWDTPFTRRLVTNARLLAALTAIFGRDIRFFKGAYVETPASPGDSASPRRKALHVDYGIGEAQGDLRNSAASWVNVAFYLTDLTPERAPLWVVPCSNRDYGAVPASDLERLAGKAHMVLACAGDAVLFHSNTVHAASENASSEKRRALFFSYRPAWAKPAGPVPEWPEEFVRSFPAEHRDLLRNLNSGL